MTEYFFWIFFSLLSSKSELIYISLVFGSIAFKLYLNFKVLGILPQAFYDSLLEGSPIPPDRIGVGLNYDFEECNRNSLKIFSHYPYI